MKSLRYRLAQLASIPTQFRHYENPVIMLLLRLGLIRMRLFPFVLRTPGGSLTLLGRPATKSLADQFTLREVFIHEVYGDILPLLPDGPLRIVDAGANIGAFSVWMCRKRAVQSITCFEPERSSLRLLRANLGLHECPAEILPVALGATARTIQLRPNADHPAATNIYAKPKNAREAPSQEVQVLSFRDWLQTQPGDFDLLKLDCECAEWEIIEGLTPKELARFRVVVIEVHLDLRDETRPVESFRQLMEERGCETIRWDGHAHGLYIGRIRAST
jgi:FkbM family methyltransferase